MRFWQTLILLSTSAIPLGAWGQEAAQDNSFSTEEIIVTAQRREQSLQAVPLAVTAITAQSLENRNVRGLADFANGSVPGLQVMPFAGTPSILSINARGIGIADPSQGTQELPIPLYIDGVPLGRAQGLGLELIEPERVEFLRGPQGQLFGRNAEGGAVQFVSRRPSGELGVDARFQIGNYGLDSQRLRVDLPEFANIKLQGAVVRTQRDGFTKNSRTIVYNDQKDFGLLDSYGYRIAAEWNPIDSLRVNYTYDHSRVDDTQPYLTWVPVSIVGRPAFSPQRPFSGKYPDQVTSPTFQEGFRTKSQGHGLTVQYEVSDAITLKSITSYRETSRNGSGSLGDALVAGGSSRGILRTNAREDVDQNQTYQELQFLGSWDHFDITLGATYFNESVVDERRSRIEGPGLGVGALGINPATLAGCIGQVICLTARSVQQAESDSYGVYGQATYTPPILGERLELTAGVRYSDDKKVASRSYIQPRALPPFTDASPSGVLPPNGLFSVKRWDPAFVVKYNITDAVNTYVRYATGYRAGGVNVRSSLFSAYGAEEVEAFEMGLKGRFFDNRFTFNVSAYQNNIKGFQFSLQEQPVFNPSLTNTINGVNTVTVKGLEVESNLRVSNALTLTASYAYMDAPEFIDFDNPLTPNVDPNRFFMIQTPKHSGSVMADYVADLGTATLRAHLDYAFSSKYHPTGAGLLIASFGPGYVRPTAKTSMMNGRLAFGDIALRDAKLEIALFGKNLLDKTNMIFGFDGAASGGGFGQYIQEPRTYGVEFRFQI